MNTTAIKTNRELFLEKLAPYISAFGMERIYNAYMFAKYGHRGQERSGGGRYFEHPRAVTEIIIDELGIMNDWRIIATALLHDVIEDTWLLTPKLAKRIFGKDVALWLSFLTRNEDHSGNEFEKYMENIANSGIWQVVLIKICDRIHNLRTMETMETEWCKTYLFKTEKYFYDLAKILIKIAPPELTEKMVMAEKLLIEEINNVKKVLA
jgi:GTP pyrophosphokinase